MLSLTIVSGGAFSAAAGSNARPLTIVSPMASKYPDPTLFT
jgi:hypothetical protein